MYGCRKNAEGETEAKQETGAAIPLSTRRLPLPAKRVSNGPHPPLPLGDAPRLTLWAVCYVLIASLAAFIVDQPSTIDRDHVSFAGVT